MKTITNTSSVTDYSGETPIVTYSNPVTTVIRAPSPAPVITRIFYCLPCDCDCFCDDCNCNCNCGCDCGCNQCCNCGFNCGCGF